MNNDENISNKNETKIYGVYIDIVEWHKFLAEPLNNISLRNACENFTKTNADIKFDIINVKKSTQFMNAYNLIVASIVKDQTNKTLASPMMLEAVYTDTEITKLLIRYDQRDAFKHFKKELITAIENYFSTHSHLLKPEHSL